MQLTEIEGLFQMDTGAPSPIVVASDSSVFVTFHLVEEGPKSSPAGVFTPEQETITLQFINYAHFAFGLPNNEIIHGHPYRKYGLSSYAFYEMKNSDLIQQLIEIERVHPYHKISAWEKSKHYILTFHDNMFECVAEGYSFEIGRSFYDELNRVIPNS